MGGPGDERLEGDETCHAEQVGDLGSGAAGEARKSQGNGDTCRVTGRKKEEPQEAERQTKGGNLPSAGGREGRKHPGKWSR